MKGCIWAAIPAALILLLSGCHEPVGKEELLLNDRSRINNENMSPLDHPRGYSVEKPPGNGPLPDNRFVKIDALNQVGWVEVVKNSWYDLDYQSDRKTWILRYYDGETERSFGRGKMAIYLCYVDQTGELIRLKRLILRDPNGQDWDDILVEPDWPGS